MIGKDIDLAIDLLKRDELVAIPTETVYGLGGNAYSDIAVAKIFAVKNRPSFDPLIVHTGHYHRIKELVLDVPETAEILAQAFMPGPLTLLLPKRERIPDIVTAGSPLVAVRIPNHPLTLELLAALDFPLAAPSANPFGYLSPTRAEHVEQQLGDRIAYILDGGSCHIGVESTIVGFPEGRATIFRKGGVPVEDIEEKIGPVTVKEYSTSSPQSPGMLRSHYAPGVQLLLGDISELLKKHRGKRTGILSFQRTYEEIPLEHQVVLSATGDLTEAARHLFSGLRYLDQLPLDLILAELVPERGLGRAINDRLRRAAVNG